MEQWHKIEEQPAGPIMAELFFGNYPDLGLPSYRDVRRELAYWSPEQHWWCEVNTGHRVAEFVENPQYKPTHWRALPQAPVAG